MRLDEGDLSPTPMDSVCQGVFHYKLYRAPVYPHVAVNVSSRDVQSTQYVEQ
jgi:hypothetical protein